MQAKAICLLASQIAKGGTGMVALAGQMLTLVLEDLKLTRNLKMNRVTQVLSVPAGSNGPFNLETDYLRTYDMFYPLATPQGMTQFLSPVTMEQYDAEFKATQTANYPYEFATDLSTQALLASGSGNAANGVTGVNVLSAGLAYGSIPSIVFSGGSGSGAAAVASVGISNFTVPIAGTGYAAGDIVKCAGGTFASPLTIQITAVGGGGVPISQVILAGGDYSVIPSASSPTTTGGSGAGYTVTPTVFYLSSVRVTAPGLYTAPPTATVTGGAPAVQGTVSVTFGSNAVNGGGQVYIYPQSNAQLAITHRYMRNQPDIITPETSTTVPWFPLTDYLVHATAARMMGITGDDRRKEFQDASDAMLAPYLIMEGDEQQTVQSMRLDPRRFRAGRSARPTKTLPY